MSDGELTILVKSPTDVPGTPALSLAFSCDATVLDVKAALARAHPNRPPAATQRLIHAGKLMADSAKLADCLTGVAPQVVHLVTPAAPLSTNSAPAAVPVPAPASSTGGDGDNHYQAHMREVEAAFQRVLRHQSRYLAMMRGEPPATPQATAAELEAVRAAVAAYDESAQRHRAAIRGPAVPGGPPAGNVPNVAPFPLPPQAQAWRAQAPAQAQVPAGGAPVQQVWRQHLVFQFDLHWGLLLKLALFVFILAQEGSPRRTKMLGALAVFVYFWQTGHLGFVRRLMAVLLPSPTQLFSYLAPSTPPTNNANSTRRLAVAMSYVYSFCYGFVCSLLPSWNPEPIPVAGPARNAPHQHAE